MSAEGGQAPWPWSELGLDGPADGGTVRRAYAARLKAFDREDAGQFQRLRAALEAGRRMATDAGTPTPRPKMTEIAEVAPLAVPPAPAPARPAPAPVPKANPAADRRRFFDDLTRELTTRVWDIPRIEALLASAPAQDPHLRREAERAVFRALSDRYQSPDPQIIGPRSARFLEAEFAWHSDGVGFLRRFGMGGASARILNDLQRLLSTAPPPGSLPRGENKDSLTRLAGPLAVIWGAWMLLSGNPDRGDAAIMRLVALVALFLPVWVATAGLVHVAGLTPLPAAVPQAWNRLCARWRPAGAVDLFLSRPGGRAALTRGLATLATIALIWWAGL